MSTVFPWALRPLQSPLSSPLAEGRGSAQLSQAPRVSGSRGRLSRAESARQERKYYLHLAAEALAPSQRGVVPSSCCTECSRQTARRSTEGNPAFHTEQPQGGSAQDCSLHRPRIAAHGHCSGLASCPQDQDGCCLENLKPAHVPVGQGFSFLLPTLEKLVRGLVGPPTPAVCPSLLLKPRRWLTTQITLKSKAS